MRVNQKPLMPEVVRPIVVIGAGAIVRHAHLPAYRLAGFPVVGVFDVRHEVAEGVASEFGIEAVYGSLEEAVSGGVAAGAVFDLALPASEILGCLEALPDGAAVLIQKPMGEDLAGAAAIRELCRAKGLKAAVNFQLRTAPYSLAARDLIAQGAIGELLEIDIKVTVNTPWADWSFLELAPRMEIVYHSIHYLDLIRCLAGDPVGVKANTIKHPASSKLHSSRSAMLLDYAADFRAQVVTYHAHDFGQKHQESQVRIEGSAGCIVFQMGLNMNYPDGVEDWLEWCPRGGSWSRIDLEGSWFPEAFVGTMASVMRWAEDDAAVPQTGFEDAYLTMRLVEACYRDSEGSGTPLG